MSNDWDTGQLGAFFEPGRAYTTQNGYLAPELAWTFACTAVSSAPDGRHIAFGFVQDGTPEWRPTGFMAADFARHEWRPATAPSWLASAAESAPASPLAQAGDAKRARDIEGEIDALMAGDRALTTAPWHPTRAGDVVHVHYEQAGDLPGHGETYLIEPHTDFPEYFQLRLIHHTLPDNMTGMAGCYAIGAILDEPLYDLWFEAGPHRLTVIRDGQVVHDGAAQQRGGGPAATVHLLKTAVHATWEAQRYLQRGEPELALTRLKSARPLPPCAAPGVMPEHAPCARPKGHRGACSDNPDYTEPPHTCPALPEQLHAVLAIGPKRTTISFEGLYEDEAAALDAASGWDRHIAAKVCTVRGVPDYTFAELPEPGGPSVAVIAPMPLLPDPRAEDEWAAEGMATAMDPQDLADYGKHLDDEDDDFGGETAPLGGAW